MKILSFLELKDYLEKSCIAQKQYVHNSIVSYYTNTSIITLDLKNAKVWSVKLHTGYVIYNSEFFLHDNNLYYSTKVD
jgi:hypothetical protein